MCVNSGQAGFASETACVPKPRIVVGMYDYGGLDPVSFRTAASFPVDGLAAGQDLVGKFRSVSPGVWELKLAAPLRVADGKLTVSVKDRQGNETRIERMFSGSFSITGLESRLQAVWGPKTA